MRLYFAFGSNMHRAHMAHLCRGAEVLGPARLDRHQFFIAQAGYASIAPKRGANVHGVLWKVTAAHLAKLDAYESVEGGLHHKAAIPVHHQEKLLRALVYVASDPRLRLARARLSGGRRRRRARMATAGEICARAGNLLARVGAGRGEECASFG